MKNSAIVIIAVVLIGVMAMGAYVLTMNTSSTSGQPAAAANDKATKVDFKNNDPTNWAGVIWFFNATAQNGTRQKYYLLTFIKPSGNLTIDLSKSLGYGNQPLPAQNISIYSGSGVFNTAAGGTGNLDYTIQVWSNTQLPGSEIPKYRTNYTALPVGPLPSETKNAVQAQLLSASAANGQLGLLNPVSAQSLINVGGSIYLLNGADTSVDFWPLGTEPITSFDEQTGSYIMVWQGITMIIDRSGNITIIKTSGPELCNSF
jgi:hypothetical protein